MKYDFILYEYDFIRLHNYKACISLCVFVCSKIHLPSSHSRSSAPPRVSGHLQAPLPASGPENARWWRARPRLLRRALKHRSEPWAAQEPPGDLRGTGASWGSVWRCRERLYAGAGELQRGSTGRIPSVRCPARVWDTICISSLALIYNSSA